MGKLFQMKSVQGDKKKTLLSQTAAGMRVVRLFSAALRALKTIKISAGH
jgi:hypothetical protein